MLLGIGKCCKEISRVNVQIRVLGWGRGVITADVDIISANYVKGIITLIVMTPIPHRQADLCLHCNVTHSSHTVET